MVPIYVGYIVFAALTYAPGIDAGVHAAPPRDAPRARRQIEGAGEWESGRDRRGKRGWQVQVTRLDDESIEGRIRVVGSAVVREARIEGRVDGDELYGVLVADSDLQVGTFSGRLGRDGASGVYSFDNGDTGHWSWQGPSADALLGGDASPRGRKGRSATEDPNG